MKLTMAFKQHLPLHTLVLLLATVMPLNTAQFLQLAYIGRSGSRPGNNRIFLECRRNSIAVSNPQIFVERSDLPRQPVRIVNNRNGQVTIVITQELEGLYSCSDSGDRSTNTLALVAYPQADLSLQSSFAFQAGLAATINCQIMPGRLSQYYSIRWMNGSFTIATSDSRTSSRSVLPGYQLSDNFSLTISDVQPDDSSESYQCTVTIDDPQKTGTNDLFYGQLRRITLVVYDPPSIEIPPEQRVIAVVGGSQPSTTFICEATRISVCTTQISWIHNGRNTSKSIDQRFQADITGTSEGTITSRLNATQLRGSDSGRIDCVAHCTVDVPDGEPLLLSTSRNTTLSVLTRDFETIVTVTTDGDLHIRINFQDGYQILDRTRLRMRYTDEMSARSQNMTSERAFANKSTIRMEVPRSRLPYERFRVDVALQVGREVGPFVSDGRVHDITERNEETRQLGIIVGSSVGGVVLIAALLVFLTCCVCLIVNCRRQKQHNNAKDIHSKELDTMKEIVVAMISKLTITSPTQLREYLHGVKEAIRNNRVVPDSDDETQGILKDFFTEMLTS